MKKNFKNTTLLPLFLSGIPSEPRLRAAVIINNVPRPGTLFSSRGKAKELQDNELPPPKKGDTGNVHTTSDHEEKHCGQFL